MNRQYQLNTLEMASSRRPVKLDWQIAKMTNGDRARHMLETSLYADCEFVVGGDDGVKEVYLNILCSLCNLMFQCL